MALYYTLPVYKDTYKFIQLVFRITSGFPREYKYTLGQDMKRDAMQLVRHIYRANTARDKKDHLATFIDDFELVKLQVRLSYDMRIIDHKKYASIAELMDSIGRQISGWQRSQQKNG
jgi:S23 ribosomal protein.